MPTLTKARKAWLAQRRKLHRKALLEAEMTQDAFCERHGYSRHHINEVLRGNRESPPVDALIARFIKGALGVEV